MSRIFVVAASMFIAGCTSMNRYSGPDAASIPVPCDAPLVVAENGKSYKPIVTLVEVDGSFIGSGHGCMSPYTYSLKPGKHRIKVAANFDNSTDPYIHYSIFEFGVEFKPNTTYNLGATFDGKVIKSTISERDSTVVAGEGQTTEIRVSTKTNAAMLALPIILKAK